MMRYIPNTDADRQVMVEAIGLPAVEDLFNGIPDDLRFAGPLNIPKALAEQEVLRHMRTLAGHNANVEDYAAFLGAGAYHHFIPSIVPVLTSRGEFMTAYTPYQPEMAQAWMTVHLASVETWLESALEPVAELQGSESP